MKVYSYHIYKDYQHICGVVFADTEERAIELLEHENKNDVVIYELAPEYEGAVEIFRCYEC